MSGLSHVTIERPASDGDRVDRCPFCGCAGCSLVDERLTHMTSEMYVLCPACGARGPCSPGPRFGPSSARQGQAVRSWNRVVRIDPDA